MGFVGEILQDTVAALGNTRRAPRSPGVRIAAFGVLVPAPAPLGISHVDVAQQEGQRKNCLKIHFPAVMAFASKPFFFFFLKQPL